MHALFAHSSIYSTWSVSLSYCFCYCYYSTVLLWLQLLSTVANATANRSCPYYYYYRILTVYYFFNALRPWGLRVACFGSPEAPSVVRMHVISNSFDGLADFSWQQSHAYKNDPKCWGKHTLIQLLTTQQCSEQYTSNAEPAFERKWCLRQTYGRD